MSMVTNTVCPDCGCALYMQPARNGWETIICSYCDFEDRQPA